VLPDGRVVTVGGEIRTADPVDLTQEPYAPVHDAITSVAGQGWSGPFDEIGTNLTTWYDSAANAWIGTDENRMHYSRWYPTVLTLPDGKMLVASGTPRVVFNTTGSHVVQTETFDPATNVWTENPSSANRSLPTFARLHLTHDGKVLYTGTGQMWNVVGDRSADAATWAVRSVYDPARRTWRDLGAGLIGARSGVFSLPLMQTAPYNRTRILIGGGTVLAPAPTHVATNLTEIVTYKDGKSTTELGPVLNNRRWFTSGILLPTGDILAVNGGNADHTGPGCLGCERAVLQAELFDGARWQPMASAERERTYHSSAILLPDGRVLVGGHAPINDGKPDNTYHDLGFGSNSYYDPSFEIYSPRYLFKGPRPSILAIQNVIPNGGTATASRRAPSTRSCSSICRRRPTTRTPTNEASSSCRTAWDP
jgi:hypothetical protein